MGAFTTCLILIRRGKNVNWHHMYLLGWVLWHFWWKIGSFCATTMNKFRLLHHSAQGWMQLKPTKKGVPLFYPRIVFLCMNAYICQEAPLKSSNIQKKRKILLKSIRSSMSNNFCQNSHAYNNLVVYGIRMINHKTMLWDKNEYNLAQNHSKIN